MKKISSGKVYSGLESDHPTRKSHNAWIRGTVGRRQFIQRTAAAGASLVIAVNFSAHTVSAAAAAAGKDFDPNAWLEIDPQGKIALWVSRSEMGQGVRTSMAMILADELGAKWDDVRIEQADADSKYGDMVTGGSSSVRNSWDPLRKAGATGRELLITAAAKEWKVPRTECVAHASSVTHTPTKRTLAYGALAPKAAKLPLPKDVPLKDPKDYEIIGHPEARVDGPHIVQGKAKYGIDSRIPGMLHVVVARCPVFGGKVKKFDAGKAKSMPGVKSVVEVPAIEMCTPFGFEKPKPGHLNYLRSGVAVAAETTWQAIQARKALEIEWDEGPTAQESTAAHWATAADLATKPGTEKTKVGDPEAAFASAATKLEAVYQQPFIAHAPMEPVNCAAYYHDGKCEIWVATQNAQGVLAGAAQALGIPTSAVTVHVTLLGGAFGRRLCIDYGVEAAVISKSVNAPVQVQWTREDDIRHDYYRPINHQRFRGGLDSKGQLTAFMQHIVAPSADATFEGPDTPDLGCTELAGPQMQNGTVPNYLLEYSFLPTGIPRGYVRAVDPNINQFPLQSFIDELAHAAGADPLEFRRAVIGPGRKAPPKKEVKEGEEAEEFVDTERLLRVYALAAEKGDWGKPLGPRRGRGIAAQLSFGSYVAEVAEVTVGKDGSIKVDRVVAAVDCGKIVNPDMVKAQVEGGICFGLSIALFNEITVDKGRIQQSNFNNFPVMRITDMPQVEIHLLESNQDPGGIGEPGVVSVAPAVGNAIFAATGKRLRRLPFQTAGLAETS
jgi:isoquinoline 1-oxidoreductase beta subunit